MAYVNILYPSYSDHTLTVLSKEPLRSNSFVKFSKKTWVDANTVTGPVCLKKYLILNFYFYTRRSHF